MSNQITMKKDAPWYFGGIASIGAVMFTHPLGILLFLNLVSGFINEFHLNLKFLRTLIYF